jgi:anti-sigma factor RsiW
MRLPIFNRHPRDEMSAYLDGELIPLRIEAMQVHLASCQSCRAELASLRELKADLAALPELPAPRSFALTPQMAARPFPERPRAHVPPRAVALANGMRLAGAAMTLALALVLVLDFTGSGTTSDSATSLSADRAQEIATTNDSDKLFESNSEPAPAPDADSSALRLTPTPTSGPAATSVPGGVSNEPASGEGSGGSGTSRYDQVSPAASPALIESPGAVTAGGDTPPAFIVQTDGTITKSVNGLATSDPDALNVPLFGTPEALTDASNSSGGVDTLLLVVLALAAGVVLTVAGSFLLPRLGREEL